MCTSALASNGHIQYGDAQLSRPVPVTSVARRYTNVKFHLVSSSRLRDLDAAFARTYARYTYALAGIVLSALARNIIIK